MKYVFKKYVIYLILKNKYEKKEKREKKIKLNLQW